MKPQPFAILLGLVVVLLHITPLKAADEFEEDVSTDHYLYTKAIIRSVSVEDQTITAKVKKGPTLVLRIDQDTILEGFYKLQELKPRQTIKVWYQPGEKINRALKIIKPLDLGC